MISFCPYFSSILFYPLPPSKHHSLNISHNHIPFPYPLNSTFFVLPFILLFIQSRFSFYVRRIISLCLFRVFSLYSYLFCLLHFFSFHSYSASSSSILLLISSVSSFSFSSPSALLSLIPQIIVHLPYFLPFSYILSFLTLSHYFYLYKLHSPLPINFPISPRYSLFLFCFSFSLFILFTYISSPTAYPLSDFLLLPQFSTFLPKFIPFSPLFSFAFMPRLTCRASIPPADSSHRRYIRGPRQ
jgi:hypothetical protein